MPLPSLRALRTALPPETRRALLWCLPAAVLAVIVRAVLLAHMPAAFVHNDTPSGIDTAADLLDRGAFVLDEKKTFLAPTIACVPALLHLPILPFIAVLQHLLGVLTVFVSGLLVQAWFVRWRWFIVPVTLAAAFNPVLLWYEHAALAESLALFGVVTFALVATWFWRAPSRVSFAALLLAFLWMAGARPEGHLFGLFVVALVMRTFWGQARRLRRAATLAVLWVVVVCVLTCTGQSGLLLFTSLLHLTPERLVLSPGVAEIVRPLVPEAAIGSVDPHAPKLVPLRKRLQRILADADFDPNATGKRAGIEIFLRRAPEMPGLALRKFVIAHREFPCPPFNAYALDGQLEVLADSEGLRLAPLLWGQSPGDETGARAFLAERYRLLPGDFLTRVLETWQRIAILPIAPIDLPGATVSRVPIHGLPWLYAAALGGLVALAARERPLGFHQLWGLFLLGLFVLIMVTANVRARFRVLFEPFWILYACALFDSAIAFTARWLRRPA